MDKVLYPSTPILIVDDEEEFLSSICFLLKTEGITNLVQCKDSREVLSYLSQQKFSIILLDLGMPYISGWDLLPILIRDFPEIPVVIVTAEDGIENTVGCIKAGACDYIVKPIDENRFLMIIRNIIKLNEVQDENKLLRKHLVSDKIEHPEVFSEIVTKNDTMKSIFRYIEAIAGTSLPILITGETGTGKELIAKVIHKLSGIKGKFVAVNIAGEDNSLVSDTLFGHSRGGFSGAVSERKGLIEQASNGTLFFDEIGDLNIETQVKLLRLLQEGKYYTIGLDTEKSTDTRFIFATNQNIATLLQSGRFRKDLYYRLQSHHIHVPPLCERVDDIPLLVDHFLLKAAKYFDKKKPHIPDELFTLLCNYHFPGNIRELEGMIFNAVGRYDKGILSMKAFYEKIELNKSEIKFNDNKGRIVVETHCNASLQQCVFNEQLPTLKQIEESLINEALKRTNENQTIAAKMLGISRKALNNRLIRDKESRKL